MKSFVRQSLCLLVIFVMLLCTHHTVFASSNQRTENILKAATGVQYVSQKVAKAYFYRYLDIRSQQAETDLKEGLDQLKQELLVLQEHVGTDDEKLVASFLIDIHTKLASTVSRSFVQENGNFMMDFSESLLEGAKFFAAEHKQQAQGEEETMPAEVERQLFLLERINKYYISHKAGFRNDNNVIQLAQSVANFENGLDKINGYKHYPTSAQESVAKINKLWPTAKEFYLGIQQGALPVIVLAATDKLEAEFHVLLKHHKAMVGSGK